MPISIPSDERTKFYSDLETADSLALEEQVRRSTDLRNADLIAVRARCRTLVGFIRTFWHELHPISLQYDHGWHVSFIARHLEAITRGELLECGLLNRLLINVPPGTMKSLIVNVFWPAWEWGPAGLPHLQYAAASFESTACARDSRRMRKLVTSELYQSLWPIRLVRAGEMSFENDRGGWRESFPMGSLLGKRSDRLLLDDPHSINTVESDAERLRTEINFREGASLRLNEPAKSAIVIIMQRLHQADLSGIALDLKLGYVHLMLPMEFEPERKCISPLIDKATGEHYEDLRTREGELLFPTRFPREVVERDKIPLSVFGVAGQFQQRPSPRGGGLFKRVWFDGRTLGEVPAADQMLPITDGGAARWVRHWDLAATSDLKKAGGTARTAGVKMGRTRDGRIIVAHVITTWSEGADVRKLIRSTAELDGTACEVSLPQDPGQAGKSQKQDLVAMLIGFVARARPESGDKYTRAEPFSSQCEAGNVYLVRGAWNEGYLDELCMFPAGKLKDQVDASSGAFARLPKQKSTTYAAPMVIGVARNPPGQLSGSPNWTGAGGRSRPDFRNGSI